ncbi:MAG: SMI1/KNR4 family protein [Muribaculaceae bacterium]|nr:SMI1/KNR4 family protein [Muribaculaceae bacterium]
MNKIKWDFVEPLDSPNLIDEFESHYSHRIPDALKALILEFNGGYPDRNVFDKPRSGMVFSHLLSFHEGSAEGVHLFLPAFENGGGISALPFATDGFGNLLCEKGGKIFFWRHETEEFDPVADSIGELLGLLHD